MTDLSVVLISKDQDWNIGRLIESVLAETGAFNSNEILLVDSASSDATIHIAAKYPINIIQLQADQRLTAAAGRFVGYNNTTGELILFLDGDMALCKGWLKKAITVMHQRKNVAVVSGTLIEVSKSAEADVERILQQTDFTKQIKEVLHGGGAAIYRREVLEQVGTFNPYLYSDEEPELCIRIRHAGYRIFKLDYPVAFHYSGAPDNLMTLLTRWRRNLYLGSGQNLRYLMGTDYLMTYMKERGHGFIPGLGLLLGLVSFFGSLTTHQWHWFGIWLALLGVFISADAYRKHSLYRTFSSLLKRLFIFHGTVKGFLLTTLDPDSHPIRFDVIKQLPT
jgi:glycosyltransferase involved in cell wall biosynthesis